MKKLALLIISCLILMPAAAFADTFDFNATGGTDSSWSWGGIGTSLSANSGSLGTVDLVLNGHNLGGSGGWLPDSILSFTTGTATGGSGTPWTFASGGSITVSNDSFDDCSGNCFSGSFTDSQLLFNAGGSTATFLGNFVIGNLSQDLINSLVTFASFKPDPNDPTAVEGSISATLHVAKTLNSTTGCGAGQSCGTFASGDLVVTPVPEPGSLTLLGTGLLGLAGFVRRRLSS